jgi:phosphate transport system substrate-binding protein
MKKILFALSLAATTSVFAQAIKLKGSDTILPIAQEEAAVYNKKGQGTISVTGGGSGVGLAALVDNTTDIATSSRKIKMEEKMKMSDAGKKVKEVIIGKDALSIIVNPGNKVTKLTREQVEGIYTGKIKNWKDVGGDDMNIVVYGRESSSGTFEFFREHVNNRKNFSASVLAMPATGAIVQSVAQTKGAVGYVGMAYDNAKVKQLAISYDGKNYIEPTRANAKNGTYPIIRPLYFYYTNSNSNEARVKPFVDFVLSKDGQALVDKVGYIAL